MPNPKFEYPNPNSLRNAKVKMQNDRLKFKKHFGGWL
jgi:hypothetical protein